MKRYLPLLLLLAATPALARERWLGRLTSTGTTVNNTTTATPFSLPNGIPLAVQCDAAASVRGGAGAALAVTETAAVTKGTRIAQDALFDLGRTGVKSSDGVTFDTLAAISISGTVNCDVYEVAL